jgi:septal ring factor EnvC (AmiA/AmiB activator)
MSVNRATLFIVLLSVLTGLSVSAQNERENLENQKKALQKKIQETQQILSQTSSQKTSSLGRLFVLNKQIETRSSLTNAIKGEVTFLDQDINENLDIINSMEEDLNQLKKEYASMIYSSQKTSKGFNELTFLFASSTFNQLFMRVKYLNQYTEAREKQVKQIEIVQESLAEQNLEIEDQRNDKQILLNESLNENKKIADLRGEQRTLVNKLTSEESRIKKQLSDQRKSEKELSSRIDAIIEAERRASVLSSVDMSALSGAFQQEKGKLPWPVSDGFISSKFGTYQHPTLKRVTISNAGIDIQTSENAIVRAVFPGKVIGIMSVSGLGNTVIIQHGDYVTAYSKLKSVIVKKNDEVQLLQELGQVLTDSENLSEIKFRIHDAKGSVNPEIWLENN